MAEQILPLTREQMEFILREWMKDKEPKPSEIRISWNRKVPDFVAVISRQQKEA